MHHRSIAALTLLTTVALGISLARAPVTHAQDASPTGVPGSFCALLSPDQVSSALAVGAVTTDGSDTDCTYASDTLELDTSFEDGMLSDLGGTSSGYQDVTVAGQPGMIASDGTELYLQAAGGLLVLDLYGDPAEGLDAGAVLQALGAAAIGRIGSIALPTPQPAPTPSPFCALLTPTEVSTALGIDATIGDSYDTGCVYQGSGESFTALEVSLDSGAISDMKLAYPDGTDMTIGGRAGLLTSDGSFLFVGAGGGLLTLHVIDPVEQGPGVAASLQVLGASALGRLASIPLPSLEPVDVSPPLDAPQLTSPPSAPPAS